MTDSERPRTQAGGHVRRVLWTLLLLALAGLLVRGAYLVLVAGADRPLIGDEPGYHGIAASFLAGEGWHDGPFLSARPPLTSWLLTLVYWVAGPSVVAGRWALVVVSSLVAPLLYLLGRMLFGSASRAPLVASLLWVVYPPSIFYSASLVTENMAALLAVAGVLAYVWAARSHGPWQAAATGALWAAAALNRPSALLLPFFLLVLHATLARSAPLRWSGGQWAAGLASFAMALAPWTVRNFRAQGVFIPVTSYGGIMFSSSNATLGEPVVQAGGYYHSREIRGYLQNLPERTWSSVGLRLGLEGIRSHPDLFLEAVFHRAINFWTPRPDPYDSGWTVNDWIMSLIWIPVLLFSVVSLVRLPARLDWPMLAVVAYCFLVTLPFWGTPRFRFPIDAMVILRAMIGAEIAATAAVKRVGRRRSGRSDR